MQCSNCGKTINSGDSFCAYCGASVVRPSRSPKVSVRLAVGLALVAIALVGGSVLILALQTGTPTPTAVAYITPMPLPTAIPGQPSPRPTPINVASTATAAPATGPFSCIDRLGCVTIGPNEPIHIAYVLATSGDNGFLGVDTRNGAELALDDVNWKALGHPIRFDGQDSGCSPEGGQSVATRIAADNTVVAVIGTTCSGEARAALPILAAQAGLSMISSSNTAPSLTEPATHLTGYFRTAHNDMVQASLAADFVTTQLKIKRAATIDDGSVNAQALVRTFEEQFKRSGGTVTASESLNLGDKNMRPVLTRIATSRPNLIYLPISMPESGSICTQIREIAGLEKTQMLSVDGSFSPDLLRTCGKNAVGMMFSSLNFSAFGGAYQSLVQRYETKYNVKSPLAKFHAQAYDAMNMLLRALQKPGVVVMDADSTLHVQKQALRDALSATDMQGVTGHVKCNPYGDCADPKIAIFQITADNWANLLLPLEPVWFPGGPDYQAP